MYSIVELIARLESLMDDGYITLTDEEIDTVLLNRLPIDWAERAEANICLSSCKPACG